MTIINYRQYATAIAEHIADGLDDYYVTQNPTFVMNRREESLGISVLFSSFTRANAESESGGSTRDCKYIVTMISRKKSESEADAEIDEAVGKIEQLLNPSGQGTPVYGDTDIERAYVVSVRKVGIGIADMEVGIRLWNAMIG